MSANTLIALALALLLSLVGNYVQHVQKQALKAQQAPLIAGIRDAKKASVVLIAELARCNAEATRVRDANAKAVADAEKARAKAEREAEEFDRRLESGKLPKGCEAILAVKVCPALMDY